MVRCRPRVAGQGSPIERRLYYGQLSTVSDHQSLRMIRKSLKKDIECSKASEQKGRNNLRHLEAGLGALEKIQCDLLKGVVGLRISGRISQ